MINKNMNFSFSFFTKETILTELCKLNLEKACQESEMPIKITKDNLDLVSDFVYNDFNNSLLSSNFPSYLKNADVTSIFKRKTKPTLRIIVQYVFCLMYRKYMKGVRTFKFMNI